MSAVLFRLNRIVSLEASSSFGEEIGNLISIVAILIRNHPVSYGRLGAPDPVALCARGLCVLLTAEPSEVPLRRRPADGISRS